MSDDATLPIGWRPGPCSEAELLEVGCEPESVRRAAEIARGLSPLHWDSEPLAPGVAVEATLQRGGHAVYVFSWAPLRDWLTPEGLNIPADPFGEWKTDEAGRGYRTVPIDIGEPQQSLPSLSLAEGVVLLFVRVWQGSTLTPYLELTGSLSGKHRIGLYGLEGVRRTGDAAGLLKHLQYLRRLSAVGRPPLDLSERSDKAALLAKAEKLKRENPRMTWAQTEAYTNVPVSTLHRWRRAAKNLR